MSGSAKVNLKLLYNNSCFTKSITFVQSISQGARQMLHRSVSIVLMCSGTLGHRPFRHHLQASEVSHENVK
jgi:hypothetical protein